MLLLSTGKKKSIFIFQKSQDLLFVLWSLTTLVVSRTGNTNNLPKKILQGKEPSSTW